MKKNDLKTGMRVRTRNNNLYLVLRDCDIEVYEKQHIFFANFNGGYMVCNSYDDNLKLKKDNNDFNDDDFDIMEVYTTTTGFMDADILNPNALKSIWKREEIKYNFENFKKGKFVIKCKTERDAKLLLNYLHNNDIEWSSGESIKNLTRWRHYKEKTFYRITSETELLFGDIAESTVEIIDFSQFEIN